MINSAIIAGSKPAERVGKLRSFWREITANPLLDWAAAAHVFAPQGDLPRAFFNQFSATCALVTGAPGFFSLRQPAPWLHPDGSLDGTSFYETKHLKSTLGRLVDFDRINAGGMRFSVGAVKQAEAGEAARESAKVRLETEWKGIQAETKKYLETFGKGNEQQQAVFQSQVTAQLNIRAGRRRAIS